MMPTLMAEILKLAEAMGVRRIDQLPGCWEHKLDARWWIAFNGHAQQVKCSEGLEIAPLTAYVTFNGWPAGIVDFGGGTMCAGEAGNESALIKALRKAQELFE